VWQRDGRRATQYLLRSLSDSKGNNHNHSVCLTSWLSGVTPGHAGPKKVNFWELLWQNSYSALPVTQPTASKHWRNSGVFSYNKTVITNTAVDCKNSLTNKSISWSKHCWPDGMEFVTWRTQRPDSFKQFLKTILFSFY